MRFRTAYFSAVSLLARYNRRVPHSSKVSRFLSFNHDGQDSSQITHVNYDQMSEIIEDYEEGGREESQYIVIDVRNPNEIAFTGKLSPTTITMPLPVIMQTNAFMMDEDDFEDTFGYEKPSFDETLVFSCAAGVRSVYACKAAQEAGYSKLVNYMGGANEWFQKS